MKVKLASVVEIARRSSPLREWRHQQHCTAPPNSLPPLLSSAPARTTLLSLTASLASLSPSLSPSFRFSLSICMDRVFTIHFLSLSVYPSLSFFFLSAPPFICQSVYKHQAISIRLLYLSYFRYHPHVYLSTHLFPPLFILRSCGLYLTGHIESFPSFHHY